MPPATVLIVALAVAMAAIYAQVTVNDLVIARYTADAWRGRSLRGALFPDFPRVGRGGDGDRVSCTGVADLPGARGHRHIALGFVFATAVIAVLVNGVEKARARLVAPAE